MVSRRIQKSRKVCGAIGLVGLGSAMPAGAANLLINPGFEAPQSFAMEDPICTGWTFEGTGLRAAFKNHTPGGRWSNWARTFEDLGGGATQSVGNVSVGATYNFSSWFYFEPGFITITDPCTARAGISWLNASNQVIGTSFIDKTPTTPGLPLDTWTQFSFSSVAPTGATQAKIFTGWLDGGAGTGSQSVFFDDLIWDGPGVPPSQFTWATNGSGDWNNVGNWSSGIVPNAAGAQVEFFGVITTPQTVFTNSAVTSGFLSFNNANTYVIAGAGQLTLDVAAGSAGITVTSGSHKINLPLFLNDNTNASVAAGATLTLADPVVIAGGSTLTKTGTGTLRIISTLTGSGPAGINVAGGNAQIDFGIGTPATASTAADAQVVLTVSGSKAVFGANQTLRGLDAVTANVGDQEIDLAGRQVRVYPANLATEELNIYNDIKSARLSGSGHDGIYDSTSPLTNYSVGVTDQARDAHNDLNVFVRLTRNGDANVDGIVNVNDFTILAANFNQSNRRWDQGDFNYDGLVNVNDFSLLAANFNLSATGADGGVTPQDWANLAAAVPEPLGGTMLVMAGMLSAGRRRRRR